MLAIFGILIMVSSPPLLGQAHEKSLYDRLGKKRPITVVVDEFVARAAADTRVNKFFAATAADPARLKTFKMHLVEQICMASAGPCTYSDKDMKSAHTGMSIASTDFAAVARDRNAWDSRTTAVLVSRDIRRAHDLDATIRRIASPEARCA